MSEIRYLIHEAGANAPQRCVRCDAVLSETVRFAVGQWVGQRDDGSIFQTYPHDGEGLESDEVFCSTPF